MDGALGAVLVAGLLFYNPLVSNTVVNVVSVSETAGLLVDSLIEPHTQRQ